MTTSQINDVIGRMWKSYRAACVARACRTLSPALCAFDRNKNVELSRKASVFFFFCIKVIKAHLVQCEREGLSVKYLC